MPQKYTRNTTWQLHKIKLISWQHQCHWEKLNKLSWNIIIAFALFVVEVGDKYWSYNYAVQYDKPKNRRAKYRHGRQRITYRRAHMSQGKSCVRACFKRAICSLVDIYCCAVATARAACTRIYGLTTSPSGRLASLSTYYPLQNSSLLRLGYLFSLWVPNLGVNYPNWVMGPFDMGNGLFFSICVLTRNIFY